MKRKIFTIVAFLLTATAYAALESGTYISDLVVSNPTGSDPFSQGANHIRLIKSTLRNTFPNIDNSVTPTDEELNFVDGVTSLIQTQLDSKASLSNANTFLGSPTISNASPNLYLNETDGAVDNRLWRFSANAEQLCLQAVNDAIAVANSFACWDRTGTTVDSFNVTSTTFTKGGSTIWHAGNDGSGSGLDADTIDGTAIVGSQIWTSANDGTGSTLDADRIDGLEQTASATPSTVAARDSAGHFYANYYNSQATNSENPGISQFVVTNGGDGFFRKASVAHAAASIQGSINLAGSQITGGVISQGVGGTGNTGGVARNISAKAGVAKTLSTSAPSGGSDGDIWYRY